MPFILLAIVTLLYHYNAIQALPINDSTRLLPRADFDLATGCNCPNTRSVLDIIWSCLSTTFVCTWVSVHPNLPPPDEWVWKTMARRFKLMFWALITPELTLTWAIRQWFASRHVAEAYKSRGWTMTHGFFLTMGGFHLIRGDEDLGTLSFETFQELEASGEIEFPTVTRDDIDDRSKGDFLAKGIALLQTSWFIVQCIARGVNGLDLTELELVTVALASFNAVMYFFWWYKPLDVQRRIPVYLKPSSTFMNKPELVEAEEIVEVDRALGLIAEALEEKTSMKSEQQLLNTWPHRIRRSIRKSRRRYEKKLDEYSSEFMRERRKELRDHNLIIIIFLWLIWIPILAVLRPIARQSGMLESQFVKPGANHVPTFYSPYPNPREERILLCVFGAVGSFFGGLHCIAWHFIFPTDTERVIWRTLSLVIMLIPVAAFFLQLTGLESRVEEVLSGETVRERRLDVILDEIALCVMYILSVLLFAYVPTRLFLLVEALVLLRQLPPKAFLEIDWADFIPHL